MGKKARNIMAAALAVSLLFPLATEAKVKRGARLRIEKTDGTLVEGELLKVSGETLVLFDKESQQGGQVKLGDVRKLKIRRKTDTAAGIGFGLLVGIGGGLLGGLLFPPDEPCQAMMNFPIFLGVCIPYGIFFGLATNGFMGHYQKREVAGLPEGDRAGLLNELRSLSRETRNENPEKPTPPAGRET